MVLIFAIIITSFIIKVDFILVHLIIAFVTFIASFIKLNHLLNYFIKMKKMINFNFKVILKYYLIINLLHHLHLYLLTLHHLHHIIRLLIHLYLLPFFNLSLHLFLISIRILKVRVGLDLLY